jgi:hypothetical protein
MTYKNPLLSYLYTHLYNTYLKIFPMTILTTTYSQSSVYPLPHHMLTLVNTHTHEDIYSRTYAHTSNKRNLLKLYELGIIITLPHAWRIIVGIGGYLSDFVAVTTRAIIFRLFCACKCVIYSELQHSLSISRARIVGSLRVGKRCYCGLIV